MSILSKSDSEHRKILMKVQQAPARSKTRRVTYAVACGEATSSAGAQQRVATTGGANLGQQRDRGEAPLGLGPSLLSGAENRAGRWRDLLCPPPPRRVMTQTRRRRGRGGRGRSGGRGAHGGDCNHARRLEPGLGEAPGIEVGEVRREVRSGACAPRRQCPSLQTQLARRPQRVGALHR